MKDFRQEFEYTHVDSVIFVMTAVQIAYMTVPTEFSKGLPPELPFLFIESSSTPEEVCCK